MSTDLKNAVPGNIQDVIRDLTFFDKKVNAKFIDDANSRMNKPEKFCGVVFDRTTQIAYVESKFIKRSNIEKNLPKSRMHAICSFVMEIAMQKYAYDKLKKNPLIIHIHIPKIHSYGIEPDNNCVVTMSRMPSSYETLYKFLNPNPGPDIPSQRNYANATAKRSQSLKSRVNTTAKRSQSLQSPENNQVKRPLSLRNRVNTTAYRSNASRNRILVDPNIRRQIFKLIAEGLSLIFNSIKVMHNDANLSNIYINDKFEVFVIDFGRAEMGLKEKPILYPRTDNSIPTFHLDKPYKHYAARIESFIELNAPGGNMNDMHFVHGPRLGGYNTMKRNG
jgi:hypothetical protein